MRRTAAVVIFLTFVFAAPASACLWDNDPLRDERRGLPGIAEILAGKWEQHSEFYYRHRVEQMTLLLEREPRNLHAYDNLAVAYEKLGDQDRAIETILIKERLQPGEYTTYANLGTFYLHKGDFENGIRYIEKALAINPDAHFGREEYQLRIAKFYRDAQSNPALLKTQNFLGVKLPEHARTTHGANNRGTVSITHLGVKDNAIDGIVGMLRFGTGTSAELYFVLGELLAYRGDKHLAYRAYLRAVELEHPRGEEIRSFMQQLKEGTERHAVFDEQLIRRERAEADAWVAAYQQFEDDLIRAGKDPTDESLYEPFYAGHGRANRAEPASLGDLIPRYHEYRAVLTAIGAGLVVLAMMWLRRRLFARQARVAGRR